MRPLLTLCLFFLASSPAGAAPPAELKGHEDNVYALAFWPGLLRRRIPPTDWIDSRVVQSPPPITSEASGPGASPVARTLQPID